MPSNSIPNYLYKRNHVWWFRKRFVASGNVIEYRLSLQTSSLDRARVFALRLQTLCLQMVDSLRGPKNEKNSSMDKTVQEQIKANLRAKIANGRLKRLSDGFQAPYAVKVTLTAILKRLICFSLI